MLGLIYLTSALVLGVAMVSRLPMRLYRFEYPALAVTLGLFGWSWLLFLLSLAMPYVASLPLTFALATAASIWLWRGRATTSWLPLTRAAWIAWGSFSTAVAILIGWLSWTHDLRSTPLGIYSATSTWADFGLHASLVNHFALAPKLPLDFPLAAGTHLTYPFMADFISAWLVHGGLGLNLALLIPGWLLTLAFFQLMIGFGLRLFGRINGVLVGLSLMLLNGSAVGAAAAWSDWHASGVSLGTFLRHVTNDYSTSSHFNAYVSNFLGDILLPQRAFVLGLAVFGAVMVLLLEAHQRRQQRYAIWAAVLIGLLPFAHPHTFIVLMTLLASLWCLHAVKSRSYAPSWAVPIGVALIVALPQLVWQLSANRLGSGGHAALGWLWSRSELLTDFWIHNYGVMLLVIVALPLVLYLHRSWRHYLVWLVPFVLVFIGANLYSIQPFAYDNLKFITYTYLMTLVFASYGAFWLMRRYRWLAAPLLFIPLIISLTGVLAIVREFEANDRFASVDDQQLAAWAVHNTAINDVFITTDAPNQPLATLAGRPILAGYRGWLYNFHLDYNPRLATIATALNGQLPAANPAAFGAKYLAVASYEPPEWLVNQAALDARYPVAYRNPGWTIYRLQPSTP
jgi:hypothetical protein